MIYLNFATVTYPPSHFGLALLSQASLPLSLWSYAFLTTTYLINCLPTPTLQMSSPYHKLLGSPPNYSKLCVFGCLCYPWIRPYSVQKLAPRFAPCVFLGYSLTQSAYICDDLSTTKTYHSRNFALLSPSFPCLASIRLFLGLLSPPSSHGSWSPLSTLPHLQHPRLQITPPTLCIRSLVPYSSRLEPLS